MKLKKITLSHCPLCDSSKIDFVLNSSDFDTGSGDYAIYQCNSCQIHFTNPQVDSSDIGQLYSERVSGEFLPENSKLVEKLRRWKANISVNIFLNQLGKKEAVILDIGCGDGLYSVSLAQHSSCQELLAIDFHKTPPRFISDSSIPTLKYRSFDTLFENNLTYDIIFCRHLLEHLENPVHFLQTLQSLLTETGKIFIEVPNFNCFWRKTLGAFYCNLSLPRHFFHFDQETLIHTVVAAGFDVESTFSSHLPSLGWSIRNKFNLLPLRKIGLLELGLFPLEILVNLLFRQATCLGVIIKKSSQP